MSFGEGEELSQEEGQFLLELARARPPEAMDKPQLPGWRIEAFLGSGGMGEVWRAIPEEGGEAVALKLLLAEYAGNQPRLIRFQREAELAATLDHPVLLTATAFGESGGRPYFTMPLVEGKSLLWWYQKTHIAGPDEALSDAFWVGCLAKIADGLAHAHAHGVVHRDVKPSNILLTEDGTTHLVDFGCAALAETDLQLTQLGELPGTVPYMAPELLLGKSTVPSPCCDVYALGAVLYEALTGQLPFPGRTRAEIAARMRRGPPPPVHRLDRGVPRSLSSIVMCAIALEPEDRYPTAAEIADHLHAWLDGRPFQVPTPPWTLRFLRSVRHHPRTYATGLVGGLALLIVLAFWFSQVQQTAARDSQRVASGLRFLDQSVARLAEGLPRESEVLEQYGLVEILLAYEYAPTASATQAALHRVASVCRQTGRWDAIEPLCRAVGEATPCDYPRAPPLHPFPSVALECERGDAHYLRQFAAWIDRPPAAGAPPDGFPDLLAALLPDGRIVGFEPGARSFVGQVPATLGSTFVESASYRKSSSIRATAMTHRTLRGRSWVAAACRSDVRLFEVEASGWVERARWDLANLDTGPLWQGCLAILDSAADDGLPYVALATNNFGDAHGDSKHRKDVLLAAGCSPMPLPSSDHVSVGAICLPSAGPEQAEDVIFAHAEFNGLALATYRTANGHARRVGDLYAGSIRLLSAWEPEHGSFLFCSHSVPDYGRSGVLAGSQLSSGLFAAEWDGDRFRFDPDRGDRRFAVPRNAAGAQSRFEECLSIAPSPLRTADGMLLGAAIGSFRDGLGLLLYGPFVSGASPDLSAHRRLLRLPEQFGAGSIQAVADWDRDGHDDLLLYLETSGPGGTSAADLFWISGADL